MAETYPRPSLTFSHEIFVRDSRGDLNGPYDTAEEAVLDHLEDLSVPVRTALRKLICRQGYKITHWYNDGVIRVAQGDDDDHDLNVFISTNGTVSRPRTRASQIFCSQLRHEMQEAAKHASR